VERRTAFRCLNETKLEGMTKPRLFHEVYMGDLDSRNFLGGGGGKGVVCNGMIM